MNYLVKNQPLELIYQPGKGAWTYHIQLPNTKHLVGKWGSLKVSGSIDGYKVEAKNLFTIKGQDKLLSINETIRKAINKKGGDTVTVTLSLLSPQNQINEKEILDAFADADVIKTFNKLPEEERTKIIQTIIAQKTEDKQLKMIVKYIEAL